MFKSLSKIALIIFAFGFLFLTGCSSDKNFSVSGGPAITDEVESNGGMVVKKGNFIYYINGISTTSAENGFGTPVKGSIVRMDLTSNEKVVVVPKVVLSSYTNGGFYIFENKVFYTSPSMEKDKDGNRLSSYLDYFSANLDGSGTKKIMTTISNSYPYKFFENNGRVYIIYNDTSARVVYLVDAESGGKTSLLTTYSNTPVFADDEYVYYNEIVYKDEEKKTETYSYNKLCRKSFMGGAAEEIKKTDNKTITEQSFTVTLTDVKVFDGKTVIYYNKKSALDMGTPSIIPGDTPFYYVLGEATDKPLVNMSSDVASFTNITYVSKSTFLGVYTDSKDSTENLCYVKSEPTFETLRLMPNPTKILAVKGDYLYYLKAVNSKNILYKKQFNGENVQLNTEGDEVLADVSFETSGLNPEIIGDYIYFVRADGDEVNYIYRFNIVEASSEIEEISIM